MKKHSFIVEIFTFIICFLFFVLPPLFVFGSNFNDQIFQSWTFPWYQIITGSLFFCFYIFYINNSYDKKLTSIELKQKFLFISFTIVFILALLFFNSLVFKFLALLFPKGTNQLQVIKPNTFLEFLFCMINFGFSAIYEEVLYRAYLPEALILLFRINVKENTKFKYISLFFAEAIGALLFAFAHIYAGWLSVLNAILAHLILRLIYRKTGNIYINITAHWLYNLLILLVF